jgi:DNA-binding SARP family transcriptional activator
MADLPASGPLASAMTQTPIDAEPTLRLHLFGPLRAYVGGELAIDERFPRRKAKALLVLLYLARRRYLTKDELLETLWPNEDGLATDSGRLKQTVLVLRRALEGRASRRTGWRWIAERDGSYYFNTQVTHGSDLEDFEQELIMAHSDQRQGDPEGALVHFQRAFELHRADFLPEFRYEDWAASEIARVRERYLQALETAARLNGARGDYGRAVDLLRRATNEDPLRESSTLQLKEWLWRTGDQAEAVRAYLRLRDLLAKRLQLEPDPKISALYEAIRHDRATGSQGPGLSAVS